MSFIQHQNWRYATKKYDATKKVSDQNIALLKEAVRLTASSYGLQPFQVLIITDPKIKQQLQPASWGQSQIVDASHLFVFVNKTTIEPSDIDKHIANTSTTRNLPAQALAGYADFMKNTLLKMAPEDIAVWTAKQTYIALGNLLHAAAELQIDTTPIEGFEPTKYNEILSLTEKGLNATLVAAIGYRSTDDATQHLAKVRKSNEELFINL